MDVKIPNRIQLILLAFYMGFAANISQILLIREILILCRGNELIIGIIFSSWFLGIYTGARFRPSSDKKIYSRVFISVLLLPVFLIISVYSFTIIQIIFPRPAGTFYSISIEALLSLILTLPVSFFAGFYFPAFVQMMSKISGEQSGGIAFYVESAGSFAGGLLFSFVLIDFANPAAIASILFLTGIAILFFKKRKPLLLLAVIPVILIPCSGKIENKLFTHAWNRTHSGQLIYYERTKYETIKIESAEGITSIYGDGILMYSLPDSYEVRSLFHLIMSLNKNYKKILIIGSGPGALLYNLLQTNFEKIYYFEHDPDLWRILQEHTGKYYNFNSSKLTVINKDLRHFLNTSNKKFDMIISIPPSPSNIMLNRFYTKEYYSLCREHLNSNGMLVTSVHGFSSYISNDLKDYIVSIYSSFKEIFPEHIKTTGDIIYLIGAKQNSVLPVSTDNLISNYRSTYKYNPLLEKEITDNFSPDELRMMLEKTRLEYFDKTIVSQDKRSSTNLDMKPVAYWKNILFNAFKEGSVLYRIIRSLYLIPLAILILFGFAFLDIKRKYGTQYFLKGLFTGVIGFVSMSTMMAMIMLYQNSQGILYYRVSLINSLFMLGLAGGSYFFNKKHSCRLLYIFLSVAFVLTLILTYTYFEIELYYWLLIFFFSFLTGGVFPVLFKTDSKNYYASASILDSMDHFGSIAGSLLSAVFLLPLIGIRGILIVNTGLMIAVSMITFFKYHYNTARN